MKIEFERSGGFAGMRIQATVDTETLSAEAADELRAAVEAADFFNLPRKITARDEGADRFQYRLTVDAGQQKHTVETSDAGAPDALQPLLRRLTVLARSH
jgi:hypothetical protein